MWPGGDLVHVGDFYGPVKVEIQRNMTKLKHAGEFAMLECADFDPKCSKKPFGEVTSGSIQIRRRTHNAHPYTSRFSLLNFSDRQTHYSEAKLNTPKHPHNKINY